MKRYHEGLQNPSSRFESWQACQNMKNNTSQIIFLAFMVFWYSIIFLVPYNSLATFLGDINLANGHSWPLSFTILDVLVLSQAIILILHVVKNIHKKQYLLWFVGLLLLIYPLITVWASLQDAIFSPIAP